MENTNQEWEEKAEKMKQAGRHILDKGAMGLLLSFTYNGPDSLDDPESQAKWNEEVYPVLDQLMKETDLNATTVLFSICGWYIQGELGQRESIETDALQ